MLLGEFLDSGAVCTECPIYQNNLCVGDVVSNQNGMPVYPPCVDRLNDDTDLDAWVAEQIQQRNKKVDTLKKQSKRKDSAKRAVATRKAMEIYCNAEIQQLYALQKKLQQLEQRLMYSQIVNNTNKLFGIQENDNSMLKQTIQIYNEQINVAKDNLEHKRKKFYQDRKK